MYPIIKHLFKVNFENQVIFKIDNVTLKSIKEKMNLESKYAGSEILELVKCLLDSSETIYKKLKSGAGLEVLESLNETNDLQLGLDLFADKCFHDTIENHSSIKFILSEEQPDLVQYGDGNYSLTLDPLDGSKSALVGIPSGAIFGVFKDVNDISDFNGVNIVSSGFFVFGINLEVYFVIEEVAYKGVWATNKWSFSELNAMPSTKMIAINASNKHKWDGWLQTFYENLIVDENYNMRWYASMVSEIKRLIIQGGLFAYPSDSRKGYENGHLRLVYEAIPMAYLVEALGGGSSNGEKSILDLEVLELHQKTSVFLGEKAIIEKLNS